MLTPEERAKALEDWCLKMTLAFGRDPREIMDVSVNEDGSFNMKGKPLTLPLIKIDIDHIPTAEEVSAAEPFKIRTSTEG